MWYLLVDICLYLLGGQKRWKKDLGADSRTRCFPTLMDTMCSFTSQWSSKGWATIDSWGRI